MRSRRLFIISTCCVSARPSSHGTPPCLIEVSGDAPVPPSWPEISTTSACAFATPAATVPTPASATSFTWIARLRVRVLQVVNQLRQILDRVDVVVRRRRDQPDAGRRVADLRDPRIDLVAGQLPAFARLGALRHLDLQVVGVDQVLARDAEARRGHLLDRRCAASRRWRRACSAPDPRRLRRCSTCRRADSSRWRASRAPPG